MDIETGTEHLLMHKDDISPRVSIYVYDLINRLNTFDKITAHQWTGINKELKKTHKIAPSVISMNYYYRVGINSGLFERNTTFEEFNIRKISRTNSGITQITVLSSPYPNGQAFSCEHNCYYCPNEPAHEGNEFTAQPRSYLYREPAVHRANVNKFDGANQMWDRMSTLSLCGLPIDKLEVMVLGGTWGSYPTNYRIEFIRDLYYAANTFYIKNDLRRERYTLDEEIEINTDADVRIIGLTLETRPDHITKNELILLRKMNCTRVQIGVQHTDDYILKKINRGCYLADTKRAIKNLLNCGLKVDVHLMFDLPFSTPEKDKVMIDLMLTDIDLRFDQVKIYPFASLDWTETKKWEDKGEYLHYTSEELIDVIIYAKTKMHPWIRINRVIRDIPGDYITAGNDITNLRQIIEKQMKTNNLICHCIRCREVKNKQIGINCIDTAELKIRKYIASDGIEYFISIETPDEKIIYGFCRLRLYKKSGYIMDKEPSIRNPKSTEQEVNVFSYLNECAIVRELHVYGNMTPVDKERNMTAQHRGFGKKLLAEAEKIAQYNDYYKIAVISGVGVRKYYMKQGYKLVDSYMIKELDTDDMFGLYLILVNIIIVIFTIIYCLL